MASELTLLLSDVAIGDRKAFEMLYKQTSEQILGVLMRIVHSRAIAEECLQEAYVQIWQRAADYDGSKGQPLTWMTAIARYRALDRLRKKPREISSDETEMDTASDWEMPAISNVEENALKDCMAGLDDVTQQAIVMSYVEGYSHSELVEKLDKPLGTVKSWIRRGLQTLKRCLGGTGRNES